MLVGACSVCASTLDCTNIQLCFSNANLTRGLCVAATARPTSTTVSCIEMPASLDPKSRSTTMDTAKVRGALTAHWGARKAEQCGRDTGVLSTLTTAPKAVETTQVLGGISSWHHEPAGFLLDGPGFCPGFPVSDPQGASSSVCS